MNTRRMVIGTLAAAALAAASHASAATPESGSVGKASPSVKWSRSTTNGGATTIPAVANGGTVACVAPSCDTFALTVTDAGGDLKVTAVNGLNGFLMVEIVKPDGSVDYNGGAEGEAKTVSAIKNAPAGEYEVRIASNALQDAAHNAIAEWATPAPVAEEPAGPPAGGPPAPAEPAAATLPTKVGRLSAKKLAKRRKLSFSLTSSAEVTDVTIVLSKGAKRVATGTLSSLDGTKKVTLKVPRKLKAGAYKLSVSARQGTRTVGTSTPLKIAK